MNDPYGFTRLTQEIVVNKLKGAPNAPALAAEIVRKTIVAGVQGTQAAGLHPKDTVENICSGAMGGLLLIEQDLPAAAVLLLRQSAEIALELHLDPSELMTWALEGVARVAPMATPEVQLAIRSAIDEQYHGAGDVFGRLCEQLKKP